MGCAGGTARYTGMAATVAGATRWGAPGATASPSCCSRHPPRATRRGCRACRLRCCARGACPAGTHTRAPTLGGGERGRAAGQLRRRGARGHEGRRGACGTSTPFSSRLWLSARHPPQRQQKPCVAAACGGGGGCQPRAHVAAAGGVFRVTRCCEGGRPRPGAPGGGGPPPTRVRGGGGSRAGEKRGVGWLHWGCGGGGGPRRQTNQPTDPTSACGGRNASGQGLTGAAGHPRQPRGGAHAGARGHPIGRPRRAGGSCTVSLAGPPSERSRGEDCAPSCASSRCCTCRSGRPEL